MVNKLTLLAMVFFFLGTCLSAIPTDGLVASYDFSGDAEDSSGNDNHGTVNGAALTTDRFGNTNSAFSFDGINDDISIAQPLPSELQVSALTISVWVRPTSHTQQSVIGGIVSSQFDPNQTGYTISIDYRTAVHGGLRGGTHFQVGGGAYWANGSQGTTEEAMTLNEWTHVVGVADPVTGVYKVYYNGVALASTSDWSPTTGSIAYSAGNHLFIGNNAHGGSGNRHYAGDIDDVLIYNRVLSDQEIIALTNDTGLNSVPEPSSFLLLLSVTLFSLFSLFCQRKK